MSPATHNCDSDPDRYHGFSLRSVTWGYREIFAQTIEGLFEQGCLGPDRQEVTAKFFGLLKRSDQNCFDHVLRQFLGAMNPRNRWIMDLPGVFTDVVDVGATFASSKLYYGIRFFDTLASGGMGDSPQQVRECLSWLCRLRDIDQDLAMAFLAGYARLCDRMRPIEIERYVEVALQIHARSKTSGCSFLRGELKTSETYLCAITQECRLSDVHCSLGALLTALTGQDFEIADLSQLDADDLIERGTRMLAIDGHLYLPARFRQFERTALNRKWYVLCTAVAGAMFLHNSFCRVHGHPDYPTCAKFVGPDTARVNLFQTLEFVRVLRRSCREWLPPNNKELGQHGPKHHSEREQHGGDAGPEQIHPCDQCFMGH